jgi:hypothetical protein
MSARFTGRQLLCAALGVWGLGGPARAEVLDFEFITPPFAYHTSFTHGDYIFSGNGGVATAAADPSVNPAPSGNGTTFYSALSSSDVVLQRTDGLAFDLHGFDTGVFMPGQVPAGTAAGLLFARATNAFGQTVVQSWDFGTSAGDGSFAFRSIGSGLSAFRNLTQVHFFACLYGAFGTGCVPPLADSGLAEFALDNLNVTAVPEPAGYALMGAGLAALIAWRRRPRSVDARP